MKRSLSLRRETLAPLTDGELVSVAGGRYSASAPTCGITEAVNLTPILELTDHCATSNCPTLFC